MIQGNNNEIFIDNETEIHNSMIRCGGNESKIEIGKDVYIGEAEIQSMDGKTITIGNQCLLSHDIDMRNGEHPIFSIETGERISNSKDICIGNHV